MLRVNLRQGQMVGNWAFTCNLIPLHPTAQPCSRTYIHVKQLANTITSAGGISALDPPESICLESVTSATLEASETGWGVPNPILADQSRLPRI